MSDREPPRWVRIYEHVRALDYNDAVTYEALSDLAGVEDIRENRGPVTRASMELEKNDEKTLIAVKNYGYRVADPAEHDYLGRDHRKRAYRQLKREVSRRASTPFHLLQPALADRQKLELDHARHAVHVFEKSIDVPQLPRARKE